MTSGEGMMIGPDYRDAAPIWQGKLYAPVAQLDRALASGAKGQRFKSPRAHQ
jgi:hypothetical protein